VPGFSEYGSKLLTDLNGGGIFSMWATVISAVEVVRNGGTVVSWLTELLWQPFSFTTW
jgi:hypothetical protein